MENLQKYDFCYHLDSQNLALPPLSIETLQVNLTKVCNQACQHCHVDASPGRTEQMDKSTVDQCLEVLADYDSIKTLDLTGGAPELNPHFDDMVVEARKLGKHIKVRHNLTVTLDGHPQTGESKDYLPEFFAANEVELVSSLPCYQQERTDKQRGRGVFSKSLESMKRLNALGFGRVGAGLMINLVHNPLGSGLPPKQSTLEADYREELQNKYGLYFNRLFTITNMPIHRFKQALINGDEYDKYMETLVAVFNPVAAQGIMCREMISVGYDGRIFDCDFNQMLGIQICLGGRGKTIFDFNFAQLIDRNIQFRSHCFGCTAGAGSSCGGAIEKEENGLELSSG